MYVVGNYYQHVLKEKHVSQYTLHLPRYMVNIFIPKMNNLNLQKKIGSFGFFNISMAGREFFHHGYEMYMGGS